MNNSFQILKRVIREGRSYILYFVIQGLIGLLNIPVELYGALIVSKLIDRGLLLQDWQATQKYLFIFFFLFIIRGVISVGVPLFFTRIQLRMNRYFQDKLFTHIIYLPLRFFMREPTGQLMSRLFSDASLISVIFNIIFNKAFLVPFKLVIFIIVLAGLNYQLCILTIIASVLSFFIIRRMGRRLHTTSKEFQIKNAAAFSFVEQILSNIELIKTKTTESRVSLNFSQILEALIQRSLQILKISMITQPLLQLVGYSTLGVVFVYGSWLISKGVFTIGSLVAFLGIAYLFFNAINTFANAYGPLRENLARLEILFSILDHPPERPAGEVDIDRLPKIHTIEFDRIGFSYEPNRPVLKNVSFMAKQNEMLGITGQSGSGKTTLMRLLARFYDPDTGLIKINGVSLQQYELYSLRSSLGIAFQDNLILPDTIRNNIAYGIKKISAEKVTEAARISQAHDFIMSLPNQYETIVGEGGKSLSGGQRQRIAIARAIISDPEILILDEATSFIEVEQEIKILQRLKEARRDKLTIIISHRLSAMQIVDRILTLDNGSMIETDFQSLAKLT